MLVVTLHTTDGIPPKYRWYPLLVPSTLQCIDGISSLNLLNSPETVPNTLHSTDDVPLKIHSTEHSSKYFIIIITINLGLFTKHGVDGTFS